MKKSLEDLLIVDKLGFFSNIYSHENVIFVESVAYAFCPFGLNIIIIILECSVS